MLTHQNIINISKHGTWLPSGSEKTVFFKSVQVKLSLNQLLLSNMEVCLKPSEPMKQETSFYFIKYLQSFGFLPGQF